MLVTSNHYFWHLYNADNVEFVRPVNLIWELGYN